MSSSPTTGVMGERPVGPEPVHRGGREDLIFRHVALHARDPGSFNSHSSVPGEHTVATRSIWLLDLKYNPEGH